MRTTPRQRREIERRALYQLQSRVNEFTDPEALQRLIARRLSELNDLDAREVSPSTSPAG